RQAAWGNCLRARETVASAHSARVIPRQMDGPVLTRHVAIAVAILAVLGPIGFAHAQSEERQEILRGGASKKGIYNIFGLDGTDLGRATVSYQSKYAPGTIVVDTAARRLYLIQSSSSALR